MFANKARSRFVSLIATSARDSGTDDPGREPYSLSSVPYCTITDAGQSTPFCGLEPWRARNFKKICALISPAAHISLLHKNTLFRKKKRETAKNLSLRGNMIQATKGSLTPASRAHRKPRSPSPGPSTARLRRRTSRAGAGSRLSAGRCRFPVPAQRRKRASSSAPHR